MTKLNPGDRVDCRIRSSAIVGPYMDFDEIRTFEIIATDKFGYYLYVPEYYGLKSVAKADKYRCKELCINPKFLDVNFVYIQGNMVSRIVSILDGENCVMCDEFFDLAEPNQENGSFVCWACSRNPYR